MLLYEKREKSTPFGSKGVSHWIGGKRTRDIRSSMKRGIELFLFFTILFFFLCGNGSKERTVPGTWNDVYIYPRHVTLEVWSKCSGKMEEFFPKGREKGFLRDARGDEIYMEEFWKNISFSTGEREGHLSCSFRVETLGGGEEVVFGEKLKGVLVNNAINICEH